MSKPRLTDGSDIRVAMDSSTRSPDRSGNRPRTSTMRKFTVPANLRSTCTHAMSDVERAEGRRTESAAGCEIAGSYEFGGESEPSEAGCVASEDEDAMTPLELSCDARMLMCLCVKGWEARTESMVIVP